MSESKFSTAVVVVLAGFVVPTWPAQALAQDALSVANLGKLGGRWATAYDVNARGMVVGDAELEDEQADRAFLWVDGRMQDLGTLGGALSAARAIDDGGRVVGWSLTASGRQHATLWHDGRTIDLNDLIGPQRETWELTHAGAINRRGQVVGNGRYREDGRDYIRGFILDLADPENLRQLPPMEGDDETRVTGLNDKGLVVGTSDTRGVLWDGDQIIDLGEIGEHPAKPVAINNTGHVVGHFTSGSHETHAFLWTREAGMVDLGTFGGPQSAATAILDDGTILGWAELSAREPRAFIYRDGVMTDVNTLLPYELPGKLNWAYGMNDSGQIVGRGGVPNPERGGGLGLDAFIANPLCDRIRRVESECFRGDMLRTTVKANLPAGSFISVTHSGEGARIGQVDDRRRARFEWPEQSDAQEVCVAGCPDVCSMTECLPPPEAYLLVNLGPLPGGRGPDVEAINEAGDVVGSSDTAFGQRRAALWRGNNVFDLGTLGGESSFTRDVNDLGQIVGTSDLLEGGGRAFVWADGVMTPLATLGGDFSAADAINNQGWIVGLARDDRNDYSAVLWKDGQIFDLGISDGDQSGALDINDAGQIVGYSYVRSNAAHAILWDEDGQVRDLGTLGGKESFARAINDSGVVVGRADIQGGGYHAFVWTEDDGMIDLGTFGGQLSMAWAVNNRGQVVGESMLPNNAYRAFLWEGDHMTNLQDRVPAHCLWESMGRATGINDRGQIVGRARTLDGESGSFLMTPAYCGGISKFKLTCNRKNVLTARLSTTYRQGTVLTLSSDEGERQCVQIDARGRGRAKWLDQRGSREVCIEQCRDACEAVDCS